MFLRIRGGNLLYAVRGLFSAVLLAGCATLVQAQPVAYKGPDDQWHVIDAKDWPNPQPAPKSGPGLATIGFNVTYLDSPGVGFNDVVEGANRKAVLTAVLDKVDDVITNAGPCDIEVEASQFDGSGPLATGSPFFFVIAGFQDAIAFQHITTGVDPSGSIPDLTITVDFGWTWNNTLTSPTAGQTDLYSVLLHEVTHGLGILSLSDVNGGSGIGSNTRSKFDSFIYTGNNNKLWNNDGTFNGPATRLVGSDNGLVFKGTNAVSVYGSDVPVYAPGSFSSGSSVSHWNSLTPRPVMNPAIPTATMVRDFRPFEVGALRDLGYTTVPPIPPANGAMDWNLYR